MNSTQKLKRLAVGLLLSTTALTHSSLLSAQTEIIRGASPAMPEISYHPTPAGYKVEEFVGDLQVVWTIRFLSDGRLMVTERPGRVRIIAADGTLDAQPWLSVEDRVFFQGESGLTGLALHPRYPEVPWVYVMYTYLADGVAFNRISRFTETNGRAGEETILLDGPCYLP